MIFTLSTAALKSVMVFTPYQWWRFLSQDVLLRLGPRFPSIFPLIISGAIHIITWAKYSRFLLQKNPERKIDRMPRREKREQNVTIINKKPWLVENRPLVSSLFFFAFSTSIPHLIWQSLHDCTIYTQLHVVTVKLHYLLKKVKRGLSLSDSLSSTELFLVIIVCFGFKQVNMFPSNLHHTANYSK